QDRYPGRSGSVSSGVRIGIQGGQDRYPAGSGSVSREVRIGIQRGQDRYPGRSGSVSSGVRIGIQGGQDRYPAGSGSVSREVRIGIQRGRDRYPGRSGSVSSGAGAAGAARVFTRSSRPAGGAVARRRRHFRRGRRAGDGGAVPQLRVGPRADRGADGAAAGGILQLARALARPPRHPGQHRTLPPAGLQRRDFRLLNPAGEALHDGFHPQCTHLRSGLAVLHPAREAVPGFHRHRSLLPPAGLLDLQLALPLDADVVAGAHRVHGADGGHRGVLVHENRAAGDPAQLRPQIQRIDCLWQQNAAFCHCSQHNASDASESSLKKHSRSV
uniref:Uncharacterized protein n=1 Tax=Ficedula albicollis TaxID=59894 RepID=A0A803VDR9_FICAL